MDRISKLLLITFSAFLFVNACSKEPKDEETDWELSLYETDYFYQMISVADDHTLYIYGHKLNENKTGLINILIRSDNNGQSWQTLAIDDPLLKTTPWSSLCFIDRQTGLIVAGSKLYRTTNGGADWLPAASDTGQFHRLAKQNDRLFGFGYGDFIRSQDQGVNWAAIEGVPNNILSMTFIDNHTGFASASKRIYITSDGGDTWQPANETEGAFEVMSFADHSHGIATRLISQGPHAMPDTRVYVTKDGGITWTDIMLEETTDARQDTETSLLFDRPGKAFIGCVNAIYSGPAAGNSWVKDYDDTVYGGGLWIRSIQKCQDRIIACGYGGTILMKNKN
jgi:photosystem II stability/assembly factor-like uncharacterized protein